MPFPTIEPTMPSLLRYCASEFGDRTFVVSDGASLTYHEAEQRSGALARKLLARNVGKGDHVGLLMPNSIDWVVCWLALTRIGAVVVPLNTFQQAQELRWTVRHADLKGVVLRPQFLGHDYQARLEQALPGLDKETGERPIRLLDAPHLRWAAALDVPTRPWCTSLTSPSAGASEPEAVSPEFLAAVESSVTPADPVVIIYTSGSTGDPKGAVHTHGTLVRHTYNLTHTYLVRGEDVLFTAMPFFWVGGLITGLHAVMHHGARLVTQPSFVPDDALELMERHRATIVLGWPAQGRVLSQAAGFATRDLTSIRRTSMPDLVAADRRAPAANADSLGMTEMCGNHTGVDPYLPQPPGRAGTVGPSIDGLTHRIVDPDTGEETARGVSGELWARGYSLMQGLYKREREDVFTADGFYRTGDGARMDEDGWIRFEGRLGDMIKTAGGTNVTPGEVEAALMACPGVLEAYVVGVPESGADGRGGHGDYVAAAVVARKGAELDPENLRAHLRQSLAAYKVPKRIWPCAKEDLPFTSTGKIKKNDLARLLSTRPLPTRPH